MPLNLITINNSAKINLFLDILRKRPDGYHDVRTLLVPIDIYDTITIERTIFGINVSCDVPGVPEDNRNLAYKTAELFMNIAGINSGVKISIQKTIPVAAGLGGGSGNAAATLLAMDRLFGNPLPQEELFALGAKLGADVPFFIENKPVYAVGRGDEFISQVELPCIHIVLVNPKFEVSTAWAYGNLSLCEDLSCDRVKCMLTSINSPEDAALLMRNSLEEPVIRKYPVIAKIKDDLKSAGAISALMSGSGPTVFGIFKNQQSAFLAKEQLNLAMPDYLVIQTKSISMAQSPI